VFTNLSVEQQALKNADISAATVELITRFFSGLASIAENIEGFSQLLCGRANDEDDDDSDDDEHVTLEFLQENPETIVGIREGIERTSEALDVILSLTQV
jgi:hypothetical protein